MNKEQREQYLKDTKKWLWWRRFFIPALWFINGYSFIYNIFRIYMIIFEPKDTLEPGSSLFTIVLYVSSAIFLPFLCLYNFRFINEIYRKYKKVREEYKKILLDAGESSK